MLDIKTLRAEFTTLQAEAQKQLDTVAAAKRDFTPEEKTAADKSFTRMTQIKDALDQQKKLAEHSFAAAKDADAGGTADPAAAEKIETAKEPPGKAEKENVEISVRDNFDIKKVNRLEFARALNQWAITGKVPQKFATITSATDGGLLLSLIHISEPTRPY